MSKVIELDSQASWHWLLCSLMFRGHITNLQGFIAKAPACLYQYSSLTASIEKGMAIGVESTNKIAIEEALRVELRGRVLEDEDPTIRPLLLNTMQVPDLDGSSNRTEQRNRNLTHSYAVQSHISLSEIANQLLL